MTVGVAFEQGAAVITFAGDGPENRLTPSLVSELDDALARCDADPTVRVIVLESGTARDFCAGWVSPPGASAESFWSAGATAPVYRAAKPVITSIRGRCEDEGLVRLAASTDIRIAGESAVFGFPGLRQGVGAGSIVRSRLNHQIPHVPLMRMVLTGATIDATEALRVGLVNELLADSECAARAREIAATLCTYSPLGLRGEFQSVLVTDRMNVRDREFFARAVGQITYGPQVLEGVSATLQRRRAMYHDPVKDKGGDG